MSISNERGAAVLMLTVAIGLSLLLSLSWILQDTLYSTRILELRERRRADLRNIAIEAGVILSRPDVCALNFQGRDWNQLSQSNGLTIKYPDPVPGAPSHLAESGLHRGTVTIEDVALREADPSKQTDPSGVSVLGNLIINAKAADDHRQLTEVIPIYFVKSPAGFVTACRTSAMVEGQTMEQTLCNLLPENNGKFRYDPTTNSCVGPEPFTVVGVPTNF